MPPVREDTYTAYFDGTCPDNPGPMRIAFVVYDLPGEVMHELSQDMGTGTINTAEYMALIALLRYLARIRVEEVNIFGDSKLVVNQVNGDWNINQLHLKVLCKKAQTLMRDHPGWRLQWVPEKANRAHNYAINPLIQNNTSRK